MENLTVVIPFKDGHGTIGRLLRSIPPDVPVIVVDDQSEDPFACTLPNVTVYRPDHRLYFTGGVNYAIERCSTDVLVLNQDTWLEGSAWLDLLVEKRPEFALIGERIRGQHPAFEHGYVHGVFQFMRRDAIDRAGLMDAANYPLWGASALWQWQICRKGFRSLPLAEVPGLHHERPANERYGSSIRKLLREQPEHKDWFIRTPPAISVVIPAYNPGSYIDEAVASLVGGQTVLGPHPGQTFQSFEVIIVNDGSDGPNTDRMMQLRDAWKGIRVIHTHQNGSGTAMNTGIKAASGKYICRMDADDLRESWSLGDLYAACEAHPHCYAYDEPVLFSGRKRQSTMRLEEYDFERLLLKNMVPAGIMFPRQAWVEAGGYTGQGVIRYGREDWAFNIALGLKDWHGYRVERSGYLYRRHEHNRTLRNTDEQWQRRFLAQMIELYPAVYKRGVRPTMACCGGRASAPKTSSPKPQRVAAMAAQIEEMAGMTLIEYIGGNVGSTTWGGRGNTPTGRTYVFGANERDRVKYVAPADAKWFLGKKQDGQSLFRVKQAEPAKPTEPAPDPSALTVAEIKALELSQEQWKALMAAEKAGKNRTGAIEFIESVLADD